MYFIAFQYIIFGNTFDCNLLLLSFPCCFFSRNECSYAYNAAAYNGGEIILVFYTQIIYKMQ